MDSPEFSVLQFNMQYGICWNREGPEAAVARIDQTVAELQRHHADLICLQEVEHAADGAKQVDPPPNYTYLKECLEDYDSWFSYPPPDERELPFGFGLALFSKAPLTDRVCLTLPSPKIPFEFNGELKTPSDRIVIGAKVMFAERSVRVFNAHLLAFFMLGARREDYPEEAAVLRSALSEADGPVILAGDFNTPPGDPLVGELGTLGFRTLQEEAPTWKRRPYVVDQIFYNDHLTCETGEVIETPVSDHHILLGKFSLR